MNQQRKLNRQLQVVLTISILLLLSLTSCGIPGPNITGFNCNTDLLVKGETVTCTVNYQNTSSEDSFENIELILTYDKHLTLVETALEMAILEIDANSVILALEALSIGQSNSIQITFKVAEEISTDVYTLEVEGTIRGENAEGETISNTQTIEMYIEGHPTPTPKPTQTSKPTLSEQITTNTPLPPPTATFTPPPPASHTPTFTPIPSPTFTSTPTPIPTESYPEQCLLESHHNIWVCDYSEPLVCKETILKTDTRYSSLLSCPGTPPICKQPSVFSDPVEYWVCNEARSFPSEFFCMRVTLGEYAIQYSYLPRCRSLENVAPSPTPPTYLSDYEPVVLPTLTDFERWQIRNEEQEELEFWLGTGLDFWSIQQGDYGPWNDVESPLYAPWLDPSCPLSPYYVDPFMFP